MTQTTDTSRVEKKNKKDLRDQIEKLIEKHGRDYRKSRSNPFLINFTMDTLSAKALINDLITLFNSKAMPTQIQKQTMKPVSEPTKKESI